MNVARTELHKIPGGCQHRYVTEARDVRMGITITNNVTHLTGDKDTPRPLYDIVRFCSNPTCERVQYAVEASIRKQLETV